MGRFFVEATPLPQAFHYAVVGHGAKPHSRAESSLISLKVALSGFFCYTTINGFYTFARIGEKEADTYAGAF